MFTLGRSYTRAEIHEVVGGGVQEFLPNKAGRVVGACLRIDTNPDAPAVVLPGSGPGIERAAELLVQQRSPVPTFLKRSVGEWEYVGLFVVSAQSTRPDDIAFHSQRAGRTDTITSVIHLLPAEVAP